MSMLVSRIYKLPVGAKWISILGLTITPAIMYTQTMWMEMEMVCCECGCGRRRVVLRCCGCMSTGDASMESMSGSMMQEKSGSALSLACQGQVSSRPPIFVSHDWLKRNQVPAFSAAQPVGADEEPARSQ